MFELFSPYFYTNLAVDKAESDELYEELMRKHFYGRSMMKTISQVFVTGVKEITTTHSCSSSGQDSYYGKENTDSRYWKPDNRHGLAAVFVLAVAGVAAYKVMH